MKIAFLNPQGNFDPQDSYWTSHPDFGGQLVYVKEVAIAMASMGIDVDILTRRIEDPNWPEFSSKIDSYSTVDNLRIVRMNFGGKKFLTKEMLWPYLKDYVNEIKKFYEKEREMPNFVTAHYGDGGISGAMFCKDEDIPYSFTAHSLGAQKMDKMHVTKRNFEKMDKKYNFSTRINAERIAMKYSAFNVVSTSMEKYEQYSHELYRGWIDVEEGEKFKVIPPGVNLKIFNQKILIEDHFVEKKLDKIIKKHTNARRFALPLIILSSRIDAKKNHISALKAYAQDEWLKEHANFLIVVRGMKDVYKEYKNLDSPERSVFETLISLIDKEKLNDHVFFLDINGQKELASLYRIASNRESVFCNPALYEPFGLSIIEAMACGLPIVATKNGGPSEILKESKEEYGILINPERPSEIANGFEFVLKDKQAYQEFKEKGIGRTKTKYTWQETAKQYLQAIEKKINLSFEKPEVPKYFLFGELAPKLNI